ncbi:transporter [Lithospermum erythrorhizon]|uniref:Transporter n=1 Tax=Lithospermum erythrorhizon TaxID=34254 RepID=A0AAV3PAY6_LITER
MSEQTSSMDKEEQISFLVVDEQEDEIEDSALKLIRKSKLQNNNINMNSTNGIDEASSNENNIHEGEQGLPGNVSVHFLNGNSTTNEAENGSLRIVVDQGQNGNSTTNESENGVAVVFEAEKIGGHQEKESKSIYYDKDEGVWKCRFCCWTYQPGSLCIDLIDNAKEHLNTVMNGKMFNQPDQCFNFDIKGGDFVSAFSGEESTKEGATIESSDIGSQNGTFDTSPNSVIDYQHEEHTKDDSFHNSVTDYQHEEHTKDDSFSSSSLQSSGVIDNINTTSKDTSTLKETENADTDLIDESALDVEEIDLEKVLQKQKTHDLYCPNCNSCITRRVILRKRKRGTRPLGEDFIRNKPEAEIQTEAGTGSLEPINNEGPVSSNARNSTTITPEETYDRDRDPEIFRCLACFSFFMPTGNGFKLFGRTSEKSTSEKDQISQPSKNWFSSIFALNKGRTPQEQGTLDKESKESNNKGAHAPLVIDNGNRVSSLTERAASSSLITDGLQGSVATEPQESALLRNMETNVSYKSQDYVVKDELGVDNGKETLLYQKFDESVSINATVTPSNGEGAAAGVLETHLDGLKLLISSNGGPELLGRSPADPKYDMESNKSPDGEGLRNNFVTNNKAHIAVDIPREYEQPTETLLDADIIDVRDTDEGSISTNRNQISINKTDIDIQSEDNLQAKWEVVSQTTSCKDCDYLFLIITNKETIVTVGAGTTTTSQITEESSVSTQQVASQTSGQVRVVERRGSEGGESYGIEIIKSIVYGGLVESITSLSVVSSAAGGGAATLQILALGLANLIGGIFIICHNLYQLKNDQADDAINQVSEMNNDQADDTIIQASKRNDKYREQLGKRKNFALHAFVAVLSYLIFGLVPPIIFGFSFRISDDRELKLAVVTAASFLCILVLAIAKAYVQTPPKTYVGTVLRYLILGFMVSGVSYVAGVLFERLLDDLGLFENSTSVPTLSFPVKPSSNNQAWASF